MKMRYVIERYREGFVISEATPNDPSYHVGGWEHSSIEEAKAIAEQSAASMDSDLELTWKPAPEAWQPDAILVSQYFDDGVEPNRDR